MNKDFMLLIVGLVFLVFALIQNAYGQAVSDDEFLSSYSKGRVWAQITGGLILLGYSIYKILGS